jgi:hypothetical protein
VYGEPVGWAGSQIVRLKEECIHESI